MDTEVGKTRFSFLSLLLALGCLFSQNVCMFYLCKEVVGITEVSAS